jgi:hypothetical protein
LIKIHQTNPIDRFGNCLSNICLTRYNPHHENQTHSQRGRGAVSARTLVSQDRARTLFLHTRANGSPDGAIGIGGSVGAGAKMEQRWNDVFFSPFRLRTGPLDGLRTGRGSRETPAGAIDSRGFSGSDIKKWVYPGDGADGGYPARRFRLTGLFRPGGDNTPDGDSASGGFVTSIL